MVTDLNGEIAADSEQGIFASDTRLVSSYRIFANGQPWVRLTASATTYYAARLHLTNLPLQAGGIAVEGRSWQPWRVEVRQRW